ERFRHVPFLEWVDEHNAEFAFYSVHAHFAALHLLAALKSKTITAAGAIGRLVTLAKQQPSDRRRGIAVDIGVALMSEAALHEPTLYKRLLDAVFAKPNPFATHIRNGLVEEQLLPAPAPNQRKRDNAGTTISLNKDDEDLYVLVENQAPGQALK